MRNDSGNGTDNWLNVVATAIACFPYLLVALASASRLEINIKQAAAFHPIFGNQYMIFIFASFVIWVLVQLTIQVSPAVQQYKWLCARLRVRRGQVISQGAEGGGQAGLWVCGGGDCAGGSMQCSGLGWWLLCAVRCMTASAHVLIGHTWPGAELPWLQLGPAGLFGSCPRVMC